MEPSVSLGSGPPEIRVLWWDFCTEHGGFSEVFDICNPGLLKKK